MSPVPYAKNEPEAVSDTLSDADDRDVSWQRQLAEAVRDVRDLLVRLGLPVRDEDVSEFRDFPLLVPVDFLNRMEHGNRFDPLLRQVLPTSEEYEVIPGFVSDPVGDEAAQVVPGLLQKYHGRALLMTTGACAVHCRYCFRREYPYEQTPRRQEELQTALDAVAADSTITEVILSGGDPLMLREDRLADLKARLNDIRHLERIRIHTRLPIVLPARVTDELIDVLRGSRCQTIMVVHANHGNEIVGDCRTALKKLTGSGIPVLNQAVLLRDINDSADAQEDLCRRLINVGVMPYYLHQLDRVRGAARFEADAATGIAVTEELTRRLPGYAVPRFVAEIAGQPSKTRLM